MGAGKSTLGKKLANRLGIPFVDADKEIEAHFKKSIGEIFADHGESYFREIEQEYIQTLGLREEFVLATGGGMPCYGRNMERLNTLGTTIYLERSAKELAHRLVNAKAQRPLIASLKNEDLLEAIEDKLAEREEYYKLATIIPLREEQNPKDLIRIIQDRCKSNN